MTSLSAKTRCGGTKMCSNILNCKRLMLSTIIKIPSLSQICFNSLMSVSLGSSLMIINYRARGPNTVLTRQPVQGRANDGGLRIGEMERDGVLAHGMSYFLNESFMVRGEKQDYYIAICNKTGAIAIYNEARNLFLSPYADGPIKFNFNPDGSQSIMNLSRFGRSFSILKVPYAFKLLIQELQVMNVQMRIITEDNIDQLLSMSYSDNISKLMNREKSVNDNITELNNIISTTLREPVKYSRDETPVIPEPVNIDTTATESGRAENDSSPPFAPGTPDSSPPFAPGTPINMENTSSPPFAPGTPVNMENTSSPPFAPGTPVNMENTSSPPFAPGTPVNISSSSPENNSKATTSVLEVDKPSEDGLKDENKSDAESSASNSGIKKIELETDNTSANNVSSSETKKIIV